MILINFIESDLNITVIPTLFLEIFQPSNDRQFAAARRACALTFDSYKTHRQENVVCQHQLSNLESTWQATPTRTEAVLWQSAALALLEGPTGFVA